MQVAQTQVTAGDILQDWDLSSNARLEVLEVRLDRTGTTGTIRYLSLKNVDTSEMLEWTWRNPITNQIVIGGPKLEDVRRNPAAYEKHLSRHIWKPTATKIAQAS